MTWRIQQNVLKKNDIPNPNEIKLIVEGIKDERTRILFIILYLTAARISEIVNSLKIKDIVESEANGRKLILFRIVNRKNKQRIRKDIPIPYDREPELIEKLKDYITLRPLEELIFPIGTTRAYQLIKKATGFNPHWIRHIRLTHLAVYYDLNDQLLVRFAGWTDSRPSKNYMELRWTDILQKY